MRRGLYVYGIVDSDALAGPVDTAGVDGSRGIALLVVRNLAAVVGEVEVGEFEGDALEQNVARPGWLEEKVRAHESVLEELVNTTTVVPMRFGSIFSSAGALTRMLLDRAGALEAALDRVRGRSEWGVKLHWDVGGVHAAMAQGAGPSLSGRDYLMRKSEQQKARDSALRTAAAIGLDVHTALSEVADAATQMAIRGGQSGSLALLNGAYLVRDGKRDVFMRRVEDLQETYGGDYIFEVTGPWPPYNFTSADVAGPRS